jgi:hypothetical protein
MAGIRLSILVRAAAGDFFVRHGATLSYFYSFTHEKDRAHCL